MKPIEFSTYVQLLHIGYLTKLLLYLYIGLHNIYISNN